MSDQESKVENGTLVPQESPETETGAIIKDMADSEYMSQIEKAADQAARIRRAHEKLMVAISLPEDWVDFEGTACLSSAGAERYLAYFRIRILNMRKRKEEWTDELGKAYQYIYEAEADWQGRIVQAQGIYGTRKKFHGKSGDKWKAIEEIQESDIMAAARHICIGNAIKTLLGLRGIRTAHLQEIIKNLGGDPSIIKGVRFTKGAEGGSTVSKSDEEKQKQLWAILWEMNNGVIEACKQQLRELSWFEGKDGPVECDSIKKLTGRWLNTVLGKSKTALAEYRKVHGGDSFGESGE